MSRYALNSIDRIVMDEIGKCLTCARPGQKLCLSENDGMRCTRVQGHRGDHAACGGLRHPISSWPQHQPQPVSG